MVRFRRCPAVPAVPEDAEGALREYFATWATRGVRAWEESWWTLTGDLGDLVAPLIGAGPGEVVFQPNVTLAHAIVFSAFDGRVDRPRIVTVTLDALNVSASISPAAICWAAETIACAPEPQTRFTVIAGTETGNPAWMAAWRAGFILAPA